MRLSEQLMRDSNSFQMQAALVAAAPTPPDDDDAHLIDLDFVRDLEAGGNMLQTLMGLITLVALAAYLLW